jgi:hypothetical protein
LYTNGVERVVLTGATNGNFHIDTGSNTRVTVDGPMKVKVDASFGPIAIGDLLVTSPTAGHAMKSMPIDINGVQLHRPGTLLGKALESLASGRGEILVLLTLQ